MTRGVIKMRIQNANVLNIFFDPELLLIIFVVFCAILDFAGVETKRIEVVLK